MKQVFSRFVYGCAVMAFVLTVSGTGADANASSTAAKSLLRDVTSFIYFTGIGCPHCANVDPGLLKKKVREGNLLVVEYEIYRDSANAPLLMAYNSKLNTGLGVPMIVFEDKKGSAVVGDRPIIKAMDSLIAKHKGNGIVLPAGARPFDALSLTDLPRLPKLWFKDRVAVRVDESSKESDAVKKFLLEGEEPQGCVATQDREIALSDDTARFAKACAFNGWLLMRD